MNVSNNNLGQLVAQEGSEKTDLADRAESIFALIENEGLQNLNIGSNNIPIDLIKEILAMVDAKPKMKVFCAVPFRDKIITELDVSAQHLGPEGAHVVSRYLEGNQALVRLNISGNAIGSLGAVVIANALSSNKVLETITFGDEKAVTMKAEMTALDVRDKSLGACAMILAAFLPKCR